MQPMKKIYLAIDLKSFYASVECRERNLDPLTTNLVVADERRTDKTICLAVSPSLKAYGIPGRARLFEVKEAVRRINAERKDRIHGAEFTSQSCYQDVLSADPYAELSFLTAPPQMKKYEEVSAKIYSIYLQFIAPEDIQVYSIDEVFMDITGYLKIYNETPGELAARMIHEVLHETGITATAGIAPNLYLCKVAMDIEAKHMPPDKNGVRIAELDEMSYRRKLWNHRPLTDFWRVGRGVAERLEKYGIRTMGEIAKTALSDEDFFFRLLGVNAEYLIDHAFGYEPVTLQDIRKYVPERHSTGEGQVLSCPVDSETAELICREMAENLALTLLKQKEKASAVVLTVGYDVENLKKQPYKGPVETDHYGRKVPKSAHGTRRFSTPTSSSSRIRKAVSSLFREIIRPDLTVRRMYLYAEGVMSEEEADRERRKQEENRQLDLFTDYTEVAQHRELERNREDRERKAEEAALSIRDRYGKNAMLRGMNLEKGATARERNRQIGGHQASNE